jgi:uncharacterized protein (TIRG00374 family)
MTISTGNRSSKWRKLLSRASPWIAALLLLGLALRAVAYEELVDTLSRLTWVQLLILTLVNSTIVLIFAGRWWIILRALNQVVRFLALSAYRLSAFAVSYFTPGMQFGGEPLQVILLQRRDGTPGIVGSASVALDKAIELLGNFTFLAFGAVVIARLELFSDRSGEILQFIAFGLLTLPILLLTVSWRGHRPLTWLLTRLPSRLSRRIPILNRLSAIIAGIEEQVVAFCQGHALPLTGAMLISLITWILLLGEYWLMLQFLGIDLNLLQTVAVLTIARFAFLFPLPGGLGALEVSQILALSALGYTSAEGLSLAFLIRARDLLFGILGLLLGGALLGGHTADDETPDE